VDRVGEKLEYDGRAIAWVDFEEKINLLLEKLFDGEKKRLIEYFSDKKKLDLVLTKGDIIEDRFVLTRRV